MGCDCRRGFAVVQSPMHLICFVLNIFLPGSGTVISAFLGEGSNGHINTTAFVFGLLQFFLAWTIVCWIWSIIHGWWIFEKSGGTIN